MEDPTFQSTKRRRKGGDGLAFSLTQQFSKHTNKSHYIEIPGQGQKFTSKE